jgi:photosystem II stability/assembly factor-like uncharacterized protein
MTDLTATLSTSGVTRHAALSPATRRATTISRAFQGTLAALVAFMMTGPVATPLHAQAAWENVSGNLAHKLSECGTLTYLSAVPGSDSIIAGVALRGMWANTEGATWSQLGTAPGSTRIANRASWITYDPNDPKIFWQSGIYGEVGVYRTTDGGQTFQRLGNVRHNDYVSVDFLDPERRTLLAGGHEQGQLVHLSTDGGKTWTNIGQRLPPGYGASTHPFVTNAGTFLVNAQGPSGGGGAIFRSRDSGMTWEQVSTHGPMAPPLVTSAGIIYWAANGYLVRSIDSGQTWTAVGRDLRPIRPVELPDQRIVAVGNDNLLISADRGATWSALGPRLPNRPDGLIYSPARQAFFIWRGDCRDQVPADAVMKLEFASAAAASDTPKP